MRFLKLLRSVRTAEKKSLPQPTSAPDVERDWVRIGGAPEFSQKFITEKKQLTMRRLSEKKGLPTTRNGMRPKKMMRSPVPIKPPAKKVPKGSEMTILHKFLRR